MLRDVSQQRVLPGAEPTMKLNLGSVPKALTPKQEKARGTPKQEKARAPRPNRESPPPEPTPHGGSFNTTHTHAAYLTSPPPSCAGERKHTGLGARIQACLHRPHTGRAHPSGS